jgi:hypothetical protein
MALRAQDARQTAHDTTGQSNEVRGRALAAQARELGAARGQVGAAVRRSMPGPADRALRLRRPSCADLDHLIDGCDCEELADELGWVGDDHRAAGCPLSLVHRDDEAESAAVDEGHGGQVDYQAVWPMLIELGHPVLLQLGSAGDVDLAVGSQRVLRGHDIASY